LSAADLVGRHLIGDGNTVWCDGPLTRAVRSGAICYLDEVVEARKDTTVVLHPLADDRRVLPIERTGEMLPAAPGFMLVISYNPGYQNLLKSLKPSTRQRFVALSFGYPAPQVEQRIVEGEADAPSELAMKLVQLAQALRRLTDHDLEETVSTRLLVMAARLVRAGLPLAAACQAAIVDALTDDAETAAALTELTRAVIGT
jgi:nitric oxide reductase NorQ protein